MVSKKNKMIFGGTTIAVAIVAIIIMLLLGMASLLIFPLIFSIQVLISSSVIYLASILAKAKMKFRNTIGIAFFVVIINYVVSFLFALVGMMTGL